MEEEIYGIIPKEKIVNLDKAPPENILNKSKIQWLLAIICDNFSISNPGTGTCEPILNKNIKKIKNNILCFRFVVWYLDDLKLISFLY